MVSYNDLLRRPTADFRKLVTRVRVLIDSNGNGTVDPATTPAEDVPVSSASHVALTDSNGMASVGLRPIFWKHPDVRINLPNLIVSPAFHPVNDPATVYTFLLTLEKPRYLDLQIHAYRTASAGLLRRHTKYRWPTTALSLNPAA